MSKALSDNSGCLGLLLRLLGVAPRLLPFRLRDDFLSPAEISFYHILVSVAGNSVTVCPKVNLNDIFFVSRSEKSQSERNKISRKHVDFLLCDRLSMRPQVGIELDDASHAREDRQTRDEFVQQVFDAAGLSLLRFPAKRTYNLSEIASRLAPFLAGESAPLRPVSLDASSVPICPKCAIPLVIRSSSRGKFYGCSNYPKCRETFPIS